MKRIFISILLVFLASIISYFLILCLLGDENMAIVTQKYFLTPEIISRQAKIHAEYDYIIMFFESPIIFAIMYVVYCFYEEFKKFKTF